MTDSRDEVVRLWRVVDRQGNSEFTDWERTRRLAPEEYRALPVAAYEALLTRAAEAEALLRVLRNGLADSRLRDRIDAHLAPRVGAA